MTGYLEMDPYGVPGRVLNLSDEFFGALGRVAALGALIELRMSDIVVLWGGEQNDTGEFMQHLSDRTKEITQARMKAELEVPDGLAPAVKAARSAMNERNTLLHSLWPGEDMGWRNRPRGPEPTDCVGVEALKAVIDRLVVAVDGLGPFLRSPVQPTPLAPIRRRRDVPIRHAVRAHDLVSNPDGTLQQEYRIDAWSKGSLKTARLRTIHGDFHGTEWPLGKEQLMIANLESVRDLIEADNWPRSDDIKAGFDGGVPPVHVEMCTDGELYIIDGQKRVLTALWHGVQEIDGYVVEMDRTRPTPNPSSLDSTPTEHAMVMVELDALDGISGGDMPTPAQVVMAEAQMTGRPAADRPDLIDQAVAALGQDAILEDLLAWVSLAIDREQRS